MKPGRLARASIHSIELYRSWGSGRNKGRCRFDPSCSAFALEAFGTRRLPSAIALTAGRLIRCNPLLRGRTRDPVGSRPRIRPRPNAAPTFSAAAAIGGLIVIAATSLAAAQSLSGGCTAVVNGQLPPSLTRSHPLLVHEGDGVQVKGVVPPSAETIPEDEMKSNTIITVSIIEGVGEVSSSGHPGTGYTWGGRVDVDKYLKYGVGLYRVEGTASGTGGWNCAASGYVKLDGNPLSKPIGQGAAGVTALGAAGALLAARGKKKNVPTAQDVMNDFSRDVDALAGQQPSSPDAIDTVLGGPDKSMAAMADTACVLLLIFGIGAFFFAGKGAASAAMAAGARNGKKRIWVKGHTALGAFSGILLGVGATVLLQQFALWPLTIQTAIVFPLLSGVATAVRAWKGQPFKVQVTAG